MQKSIIAKLSALCIGVLLPVLWMLFSSGVLIVGAAQEPADISSWSALQEAINSAVSGDTITLNEDVTAGESDTALIVPNGQTVTLDLNGHTIDRALTESRGDEGSAIHVLPGAMLTVTDSSETGAGTITGGYASCGGGIDNDGTLILKGGCITENAADESGGGAANFGCLIVDGGRITGNMAALGGGGIYNAVKGYMTIGAAAVYDNNAPKGPDIHSRGTMKTIGGETVYIPAIKSAFDMFTMLPSLVLLAVLLISVQLDNYLNREQKRIMYIITLLVVTLVIQNYLDARLYQFGKWTMLRTVNSIYGYAVRPAILGAFLHIINPNRSYRAVWTAVSLNAALYVTALFSPLTFFYASDGHFHPGPLNPVCLILSGILFLYCIHMTIKVFRPKSRKETWLPVLALAVVGISVVLDYAVAYNEQAVSFLTIAIVISCMMYYIWLHLQFVREHERALQTEHRIQIMMTQIQPHFLFNTLTAIRALCSTDPSAASRTIGLFSAYLRQNLESLDKSELIPLDKELEHTRIYTEIEMIRFPNIRIEYDIQDGGYGIPPLTVQPLVENAIRHGVRSCTEGIVRVSAYRENDTHLIVIEDNGIGFETQPAEAADGKHIGLSNVRERVERMCSGSMEIDSRLGEGTRIVLKFPVHTISI